MTITVVLAEDHTLVRVALRRFLEGEPGIDVVGEAADGFEALALVERHRPRVLVIDLMLPGMSGLAVTRQVARDWPDTRVVILSMHANEGYVVEALRSGALAYVVKNAEADDLFAAVHRVDEGRRFLSGGLSERAIDALARTLPHTVDPLAGLSVREQQAFEQVVGGATTAQIAERLFISPRTAEKHRASAMRKLGLRTPHDLVRFAVAHGLLPGDADRLDALS
ncbi:MAG TPA: response regulator transcription factor [Rhodothermales bacterium]|nr:response regulator transcription factor [Rhodothermales bacterium]